MASSQLPIEGLFTCEDCGCQFGVRKYFENHLKSHEKVLKNEDDRSYKDDEST